MKFQSDREPGTYDMSGLVGQLPTKVLAGQWTLSQPEGADWALNITTYLEGDAQNLALGQISK